VSERPGLRHELKFVCDEAAHPVLRMALRLDRAGLRQSYPMRRVHSLYLDTTYQRALQENLAGMGERTKVRLRWYGAAEGEVTAVLERKRRENTLGWKETWPVPGTLVVAGAERRALVRELARRAEGAWREHLAVLEPAQWISYRREYLVSADGRVRVTLDRELRFSDQRLPARLSPLARTPASRLLVLEVKCAPEHLGEAREIVSRLAIPMGRCSKYVLAADASGGPLPSVLAV